MFIHYKNTINSLLINFSFRSHNIECHLVSPEEIKNICPLLKVDDLYGGLWIPNDGVGDPYQICLTLLEEAAKKGSYCLYFLFMMN